MQVHYYKNGTIYMLSGIIFGAISAFLQSSSYVASKVFINRHQKPILLTIYSQLLMGIVSICVAPFVFSSITIEVDFDFILISICAALLFIFAQSGFFMSIRDIEASRSSSLLGLKLVILALFTTVFGTSPSLIQWIAVVLCAIAAVGINFSGGKMPLRGCLWIGFAIICYSLCDIALTKMIQRASGDSIIFRSLSVICINYTNVGIVAGLAFLKIKFNKKILIDSIPFTTLWFTATVTLISCFGILGTLHGNIIQSGRGLISVILGAILLNLGYHNLESKVSRKMWIRRFFMAILMLIAMILYAQG